MNTSKNEKTFVKKMIEAIELMSLSPAEIQWESHKQQASELSALTLRVSELERKVDALLPVSSSNLDGHLA